MSNERQKILITGASGFIFSNFIRSAMWEKRPWDIVGVDRFATSSSLNTIYVSKHYNNYICDITDKHIFGRIVEYERPDLIIHAAAHTSVDEALTTPSIYIHNNVCGTETVVNTAIKFKVPKLIYISTDEVYGHLTSEDDDGWSETAPLNPRNMYSASKASGEHIVRAYGNCNNFNYNIVRMANNYGPRQTTNKLIPRAIKSITNNEKIKLYGKGQHMRDWLHVRDTYSAISTIMEKGSPGETYNIGAGQEFTSLEVAQLICSAMKKEMQVGFVEDRIAHDFRYSLNSDKLKKIGWEPKVKFKDGIQDTVESFMMNKYWLE
jgi:dTDP-glucose 4,6-dehydratase